MGKVQAGGAGNPEAGQSPVEVVNDALERFADLSDEDMVPYVDDGPGGYVLHALTQAGWRVVRLDEEAGRNGIAELRCSWFTHEWTPGGES